MTEDELLGLALEIQRQIRQHEGIIADLSQDRGRVLRMLQRMGWSQRKMAARLGISQSMVSRITNGR